MSIKFLDLYNDVASQPWSMFDSGAETKEDFEPALVSSINKAIVDIWYSYPFSFRIKKYNFFTLPNKKCYELPNGNILSQSNIEDNLFAITLNNSFLNLNENITDNNIKDTPQEFFIDDDNLILFPIPDKKYQISMKYLSLSIGFDSNNNEIFYLENPMDYIDLPHKYETLFKNTVLAKALVDSIASVNDENYVGYKLQFDKAYNLLIKVSSPIKKSMSVIF